MVKEKRKRLENMIAGVIFLAVASIITWCEVIADLVGL